MRCKLSADGLKLCRRGHTRPKAESWCRECRRQSNRRSAERNIEKRRAVSRECARRWRAANPDKVREANRKWNADNPERRRELCKKSAHANRAHQREYMRGYRERNREQIRQWDRDWRAANRDRALADANVAARARYAKDPDPKKLRVRKRRAAVAGNDAPGVSPVDWKKICERHRDADGLVCCVYCGRPCKPTVDHVIPITRGGRDAPDNVVPACKSCNSSKGNRLLGEWDPPLSRVANDDGRQAVSNAGRRQR